MGASAITTTASVGAQVLSARKQASAIRLQNEYEQSQARFNEQILEVRKEELLAKANEDAERRQTQIRQMLGAQKVSLAAQGIEVDTGTALDIQEETREIGIEDAMTIKNNAWRQAWGLDVEQMQIQQQAEFGNIGASNRASNTLAAGGLNAITTAANYFSRK